ncbi:MAG: ribbon-helix-helix domain-containing protein [Candidatus Helarchaeota archaeon]
MKKLKTFSISLPFKFVEIIDELVDVGYIVSRAEFVRTATAEKLQKEIELINRVLDHKEHTPEYHSKQLFERWEKFRKCEST